MTTPIPGAKFPLYLTDKEWLVLIGKSQEDTWYSVVITKLKDQLEKLGYKP